MSSITENAIVQRPVLYTLTPRALTEALVFLIVAASGLVDLTTSLLVGPVSTQGLLTVAYFLAGLVLLSITPVATTRSPVRLLPLLLFVLWAVSSLAWTENALRGIQNVMVIGIFALMLQAARGTAASNPPFAFWMARVLRNAVLAAAVLYGASVVWFGPGTNTIIGPRSFGLFALFGVAYFLSGWRYGSRSSLFGAIALTGIIGASQSRLALGVSILLFPLAQFPTTGIRRVFKMVAVVIAAAAVSYGAFFYFDSLRERFVTGDVSLKIGSFAINGSGRAAFWRTTMASFWESPFAGKGAGSSEGLIESVYTNMRHPHNDYLRIAHDYGLIGAGLWWMSMGGIGVALWRAWRVADQTFRVGARLELTALLSLMAFALEMTAENTLVYVFIVAPLGLLVGSALGLTSVIRNTVTPHRERA